jgi:hypothetical protein
MIILFICLISVLISRFSSELSHVLLLYLESLWFSIIFFRFVSRYNAFVSVLHFALLLNLGSAANLFGNNRVMKRLKQKPITSSDCEPTQSCLQNPIHGYKPAASQLTNFLWRLVEVSGSVSRASDE